MNVVQGSPRPELALLLACAPSTPRASAIEPLLRGAANDFDWSFACALAAEHGVAPLCHRQLMRCRELVPPAVLERFRSTAASEGLRSIHLARTAVRVLGGLRDAGIPSLPFKGPALAAAVYGDVALRPYRDLDLLVAPADRERAAAWLEDHGYRLDLSEETADERRGREYHLRFVQPAERASVELHWLLQPPPWPLPLRFESLLARSRSVPAAGGSLPVLGWEDTLLVVACHGGRHGFAHLLWVCDVERIVRAWQHAEEVDWPALLARASDLGCRRLVVVSLLVAQRLLGLDLAPPIETAARADAVARELAGRLAGAVFEGGHGLTQDQLLVALRERLRERLRYVAYRTRRLATVYVRPSERDRGFVALPRPVRFAYPFVRALRFARQRRWSALRELGRDLRAIGGALARWR